MSVDAWDIFAGLSEGKQDAEFRQLAQYIVQHMGKMAEVGSRVQPKVERGPSESRVVYDMSGLMPNVPDFELVFALSDGEEEGGFYQPPAPSRPQRVGMRFSRSGKATGLANLTDQQWKEYVAKHASNIVEKNKAAWLHEVIHMLDVGRLRGRVSKVVGKSYRSSDSPAYYADPLELNAFIQMGMSKMVDRLKGVKSPQGRRVIMGGNAQEFFQRLLKQMDPNFVKHLSDTNRKKLAKRAYQLWGELVKSQSDKV